MKKRSRATIALALLALGCSGPEAEAPDAAGTDAASSMIDAAGSGDAATPDAATVDAFRPDAFAPPDASDYDAGPPPTWDEVYALFTNARCGGARGCHYAGTDGSLSLATSATACTQLGRATARATCSIRQRVVAGNPDASYLYRKLVGPPSGCGVRMPDRGTPFTPAELSIVERWILAGAICP